MRKKNRLILNVFLLLSILIGLIFFIIVNKRNVNEEIVEKKDEEIIEKLTQPREYKGYAFYDIHFENNQQNEEELKITVKNIKKEEAKEYWIAISFKDENGEVFARTPVKIFALQPMETHNIYISSTADLKKASDFFIEDTEPPLEMEPEEFE